MSISESNSLVSKMCITFENLIKLIIEKIKEYNDNESINKLTEILNTLTNASKNNYVDITIKDVDNINTVLEDIKNKYTFL